MIDLSADELARCCCCPNQERTRQTDGGQSRGNDEAASVLQLLAQQPEINQSDCSLWLSVGQTFRTLPGAER